jgi:cellulose synthase/poly-beta-1,6-N-acetylglucosamine synthase-like glycosyltransferase
MELVNSVSHIAFIGLTGILLYVYFGYPALLFLLSRLFPQTTRKDDNFEPSVTLVISAYNEERVIGEKLENAFRLDYPAEKMKILVVSDCSTDRTDRIAESYIERGARLIRIPERRGKTAGLNIALPEVQTDIVVFSDANAMYHPSAVRKLVRHFADKRVGYVVGHAGYDGEAIATAAGRSENLYWNLETKIKEWESAFSSVVGGDGAIYAIRRELYEPLEETDINDFVNPLQIFAAGYRGIFDPEARCSERPAGDFEKEFRRKVRITNRSLNGFLRVPEAWISGRTLRFSWQLISHKVLRWFSPFLFGFHYLATLAVGGNSVLGTTANVFLVFYGSFASLAFAGWVNKRRGKASAIFYLPYYFVLMNVAAAAGVWQRAGGTTIAVWKTAREVDPIRDQQIGFLPILLLFIVASSLFRVLT